MPSIKFCDRTFPTPAENLACDEALLDAAEAGEISQTLRFWEVNDPFVVVGYGNHISSEVHQEFCAKMKIPILRRCSGGGTVLQTTGVLNYALVLRAEPESPLQTISGANQHIMQRNRDALAGMIGSPVDLHGFTDLTLGGRKFSGNAQRRRKNYLLFHGSFLLDADFELIEKALKMPSKKPDYRHGRTHGDFLVNLKVAPAQVKAALCRAWGAEVALQNLPVREITRLASERYSRDDWNLKFR
jgi:lipoate---protein ligase